MSPIIFEGKIWDIEWEKQPGSKDYIEKHFFFFYISNLGKYFYREYFLFKCPLSIIIIMSVWEKKDRDIETERKRDRNMEWQKERDR